jgi:hypothetical protein
MTYWSHLGFFTLLAVALTQKESRLFRRCAEAVRQIFIVYRWSHAATGSSGGVDYAIRTGGAVPASRRVRWTRCSTPLVDAVIIPSARGSNSVLRAATTARRANAQLVVLASKGTSAVDTANLLRSHRWSANSYLVVDVNDYIPQFCGTAESSDLGAKRNLGLALARMLSWENVLFLDDDVQALTKSQLRRTRALLLGNDRGGRARKAVGWAFERARDFSIVGHAYLYEVEVSPSFASGGALAVNCVTPTPPFPTIYNEDLLFLLGLLRRDAHSVCVAGTLRQDEYDPFSDPARAASQEFGDALIQGLYSLHLKGASLETAKAPVFWEALLIDRRALQTESAARLARIGVDGGVKCVEAASAQHNESWPQQLADYVSLWETNVQMWHMTLNTLPKVTDLHRAAKELGLKRHR